MKITLRTPETQAKYIEKKKTNQEGVCVLCAFSHDPAMPSFETLKIAIDEFPYDRVAKRHYMIMTKRHVQPFEDLTALELSELLEVYDKAAEWGFQAVIANIGEGRSLPGHLHLHLVDYKEHGSEETDLKGL